MEKNIYSITVGERIGELIFENSLTADSLGKLIGVSGASVARWRRLNAPIKLSNLIKLARYFNCSVDFICGRTIDKGSFIEAQCSFPDNVMRLMDINKLTTSIFSQLGMSRHILYD